MEVEIECLHEIYRLIAQLTSLEDCFVIYQNFKGLTITFPTKLIEPSFVKKYITKEVTSKKTINKKMIQHWALSFNYSERQIRRFLKEIKSEHEKNENQPLPNISKWLNQQSTEENNDGRSN